MDKIWTDPVVWICVAVVLVGFVSLLWAIKRLFRKQQVTSAIPSPYADALSIPMPQVDKVDLDVYREPPPPIPPAAPAPAPVNKDVAERLEDMTKRLAEMQNVLTKQAVASGVPSSPAGAAAGLGQGFSPETVDKLLKIIGNVIQQVDILQKSLNPDKGNPPAPQNIR